MKNIYADSNVNPFKDYSLDEPEYANSKINTMCNYVYDEYKQSENIAMNDISKIRHGLPAPSDKHNRQESSKSSLKWSENGYRYSYQMTPQEYNVYVKEYLTLIETHR